MTMLKRAAYLLPPVRRLVDERDRLSSELARTRRRARRARARNQRVRHRSPAGVAAAGTPASPYGDRFAIPLAPDGNPLGFLFIVTYGRSGSTLLQGILNSIPGVLIRGENGGVLNHVYRGHAIATELKTRFVRKRLPKHAMFGIQDYPVDVAIDEIRHFAMSTLLRPEADTRVVGFKEIRWDQDDAQDFITFLQDTFPGAKFVINTRDLDAVSRSKWWADTESSRAMLEEIEGRLLRIGDQLGGAAFRVHYDDYVESPEALQSLFDWMGEPFDVDRVKAVLSVRHSF